MTDLSRRYFALAAGAALAAASVPARAENMPNESSDRDAPYAPWKQFASGGVTGTRATVLAATLAANPHDTQPWRFCVQDDAIALYADETRNLGAMDPYRREMHIGLGCALTNLSLAAGIQGREARIALAPGSVAPDGGDKAPRLAARVTLAPSSAAASPLAAAIARRHTDRSPYDTSRAVTAETLAKLAAGAGEAADVKLILLTEAAARADFATATVAATQAIIADATMIADSDSWFRGSDAEIARHRDGPNIRTAGLSSLVRFMASILPEASPERSHAAWLDLTRERQLATAGAFGLIAVRGLYDREQTLRAGMLWQRLHLQGTILGLGMQPMNQLPEMVDRERQLGKPPATAATLAKLAGDPAWLPTFAFRLGWPTVEAPASPRRDLDSVIGGEACKA